jgi:hypothetical protein
MEVQNENKSQINRVCLHWIQLAQNRVQWDTCKHSYEPSSSIKARDIPEQLSASQGHCSMELYMYGEMVE